VDDHPASIRYRDLDLEISRGTTVAELMKQHPFEDDGQVYAANVNNRIVSLGTPIVRSGTVEPVTYQSMAGARIYRRHLTLMLYEVFYDLYPDGALRVGQAISEGYYFEVDGPEVGADFLRKLDAGLRALVEAARPFRFRRAPVEEARRLFVNKGVTIKRQLLNNWPSAHVGIMSVGEFVDFALGPIAPHTGFFDRWELFQIERDFVLQFPSSGDPTVRRIVEPQPKLYRTLKESRAFGAGLGISHVVDLNDACIDGSVRELIQVFEGRHEKKIVEIAREISEAPARRLVMIAGPSSAGKTTFSKRLAVQLIVEGHRPLSISLDNYYVNREDTPHHPNGSFDFEALEAIDLTLFNDHLRRILDGERVDTPRYDFNKGRRASRKRWQPIQLQPGDVLMIEGIHGLNDALTPVVPHDEKYKIYINALNPLAIDNHNRLHTSDTRLIRRLVRDRHYRGYSASQTIASWGSVRGGERRHIFPFQNQADVIFDSSLIYEFPVLKIFAERYLMEVSRSDPAFAEAYRLRKFLAIFVPILPGDIPRAADELPQQGCLGDVAIFVPILPGDIPQTSLLREFIGGSSFSY